MTGEYIVPSGQTTTRFTFAWVSADQGTDTGEVGNLLDGVVVAQSVCAISVSKAIDPPSTADPVRPAGRRSGRPSGGRGRRGLGPLPNPLSLVRVSERPAAGTDGDVYTSMGSCTDAVTGERVAAGAGTELTVPFSRPTGVACTFANVRAPALVLEKQTYPAGDPGRFDLRLDERMVAPAAADGTVTEPPKLARGQAVRVSSVPVAGTDGDKYGAAITCYTHELRRAAVERGRDATIPDVADSLGACVLADVRAGTPDPRPPIAEPAPEPGEPGGPPVPPSMGGVGEVDLAVRARAPKRRVSVGHPARFKVTVTNHGTVDATAVRLILSARQAGLRAQRLTVTPPGSPGPCAARRGLGSATGRGWRRAGR